MTFDAVVLHDRRGKREFHHPAYNLDVNEGYTQAWMKSTGRTLYVVYQQKDLNKENDGASRPPALVDWDSKSSSINLGFTARSLKGFNMEGIVLFEHSYYSGTSEQYRESIDDITESLPSDGRGLSSFIVLQGVWAFYDNNDTQLEIEGMTKFGPGTCIGFAGSNVNDSAEKLVKICD